MVTVIVELAPNESVAVTVTVYVSFVSLSRTALVCNWPEYLAMILNDAASGPPSEYVKSL